MWPLCATKRRSRAGQRVIATAVTPVEVGTISAVPLTAGVAKREVSPTVTVARGSPVAASSPCSVPFRSSAHTVLPTSTGDPLTAVLRQPWVRRSPATVIWVRPSVQGRNATAASDVEVTAAPPNERQPSRRASWPFTPPSRSTSARYTVPPLPAASTRRAPGSSTGPVYPRSATTEFSWAQPAGAKPSRSWRVGDRRRIESLRSHSPPTASPLPVVTSRSPPGRPTAPDGAQMPASRVGGGVRAGDVDRPVGADLAGEQVDPEQDVPHPRARCRHRCRGGGRGR